MGYGEKQQICDLWGGTASNIGCRIILIYSDDERSSEAAMGHLEDAKDLHVGGTSSNPGM
jgi:hypothetical protein